MRAPWAIQITQLDNGGFIVQAGCKTLVYELTSIKTLLAEIEAYFADPPAQIKAFSERFGWGPEGARRYGEEEVAAPIERPRTLSDRLNVQPSTAPYGERRSASQPGAELDYR